MIVMAMAEPLIADNPDRTRGAPTCCRSAGRPCADRVPIVYAETRRLAEEWTYRSLAAAHAHRPSATPRNGPGERSRTGTGSATGHVRRQTNRYRH